MKLNLIMPMAGGGTRFSQCGYSEPKPLITLFGKPFFFHAAQSISKYVALESITFVVLKQHIEQFSIDREIKKCFPEAKIAVIPAVLPGAVLTCLHGVEEIADGEPILFNDCDHAFLCRSFYDFCAQEKFQTIDGGLLTFKSHDERFSFAQCGEDGFVVRTVEKKAVSDNAICGAYYFKDKQTFLQAANAYLKNCEYKEYFVSGVYNELAKNNKKVTLFETDEHLSFGTPEELTQAKKSTSRILLE